MDFRRQLINERKIIAHYGENAEMEGIEIGHQSTSGDRLQDLCSRNSSAL
jgi:hypothetical protein